MEHDRLVNYIRASLEAGRSYDEVFNNLFLAEKIKIVKFFIDNATNNNENSALSVTFHKVVNE